MLSTPPAFILSQDQTLIKKFVNPMSEIILACIFPNHLYCYWFVRSLISSLIRRSWNSCLEFQGCHVVNFSRFFVFAVWNSLFRLSHSLTFVKNFFNLFSTSFSAVRPLSFRQTFVCLKRQLIKNITISCVCQLLFYSFFQEQFLKISDCHSALPAVFQSVSAVFCFDSVTSRSCLTRRLS